VDNLLLASCEAPECGMDFFFKSHRRILWIDARGISNMLDALRVDYCGSTSNASRTNSILSPDFVGRPILLSSRKDPVL
jgi:hypothetical protein